MKQISSLKSQSIIALIAVLFFLSSFISCNESTKGVLPTIAQTVVGFKDLSQLETFAVKADLVVTLSNKNTAPGSAGNFTAFAPTNQAFAKIGLVNPEDLNGLQAAFLKDLLKYHLCNASFTDEALGSGATLSSLLGDAAVKRIVIRDNEKYINGSKIISANSKADNGITHVINRVLLATNIDIANTIMFFAEGKAFVKPELSFLAEAVVYCDLVSVLSDRTESYTVFAPTDKAFKQWGKVLGVEIEHPVDVRKLEKSTLTQILLNHIVKSGGKFTSELYPGNLQALSAKQIALGEYENGLLSVKGSENSAVATMLIPDIQTSNGVVHIIDSVLSP